MPDAGGPRRGASPASDGPEGARDEQETIGVAPRPIGQAAADLGQHGHAADVVVRHEGGTRGREQDLVGGASRQHEFAVTSERRANVGVDTYFVSPSGSAQFVFVRVQKAHEPPKSDALKGMVWGWSGSECKCSSSSARLKRPRTRSAIVIRCRLFCEMSANRRPSGLRSTPPERPFIGQRSIEHGRAAGDFVHGERELLCDPAKVARTPAPVTARWMGNRSSTSGHVRSSPSARVLTG